MTDLTDPFLDLYALRFEERLDHLREDVSLFDDWEGRFQYVMDLAKSLPPLSEEECREENRVLGCVSRVWLVIDKIEDNRLFFRATSDALMVRGLIAVVALLLNGASLEEIKAFDLKKTLSELNLAGGLSSQRTNGLLSLSKSLANAARS